MSWTTANYGYWEFWAPYAPENGFYGEHKCIFDGANKKIYINPEVTEVDVRSDLYSDWKEWVMVRDNAKYAPAIRTIGGDPIGGGQFAGDIYFLINGWQIVVDHNISLSGVLFSDDFPSPYIVEYGGVVAKVSNLAIAYNSAGGGGTDLTPAQIWSYNTRSLTTTPPYNGPSASQIRAEVDTNSTQLSAIKAKTDTIQTPPNTADIADAVWNEDLGTHPSGAGNKLMNLPTKEEIALQTWQTPLTITLPPGSFGHYIAKKILTVSRFIGLK